VREGGTAVAPETAPVRAPVGEGRAHCTRASLEVAPASAERHDARYAAHADASRCLTSRARVPKPTTPLSVSRSMGRPSRAARVRASGSSSRRRAASIGGARRGVFGTLGVGAGDAEPERELAQRAFGRVARHGSADAVVEQRRDGLEASFEHERPNDGEVVFPGLATADLVGAVSGHEHVEACGADALREQQPRHGVQVVEGGLGGEHRPRRRLDDIVSGGLDDLEIEAEVAREGERVVDLAIARQPSGEREGLRPVPQGCP
jgi:hypothetical protein